MFNLPGLSNHNYNNNIGRQQTLFIFDIETVADTNAVKNLTGSKETDTLRLIRELEEYHLTITEGRNSFLRQPFHKVVAISFLEAEICRDENGEHYILKDLRSGGRETADEKELLEGFFRYLEKTRARLVSFNGRTFDLPVLHYRAMMHGISAKWYYINGDKWNNYSSRYCLDWHCDLLEALSDFGASARIKLNEICSILGFPGKFGIEGSKINDMYMEGRIKEIRDYCETDVLNTYLVYLRYMHHRGSISTLSYNEAIGAVLGMINARKETHLHLVEFLTAWNEACRGKFTL